MSGRGVIVLLEGIDRSGKSTQCQMLQTKLKQNSIPFSYYRFPVRETESGKKIDAYLTNTNNKRSVEEMHELFSVNRSEFHEKIVSDVLEKKIVIIDRYAHSGVVFSASNGMDFDKCKKADEGLPAPDIVIYLDITPVEGSQRGDYGKEIYENIEFQKKAKENYEKLMDESWFILDASRTPEEISEKVYDLVINTINIASFKKINTLWQN